MANESSRYMHIAQLTSAFQHLRFENGNTCVDNQTHAFIPELMLTNYSECFRNNYLFEYVVHTSQNTIKQNS